jgi:hypothetical protein
VAKSFLVMLRPQHISHLTPVKAESAFTTMIASFLMAGLHFVVRFALLQDKSISRNQELRLVCFFVVILSGFS